MKGHGVYIRLPDRKGRENVITLDYMTAKERTINLYYIFNMTEKERP